MWINKTKKSQKGAAQLVALLLAVSVTAAAIPYAARESNRRLIEQKISYESIQATQMAVGVRSFVSRILGNPAVMPSNPMTITGVSWLKHSSCSADAIPDPSLLLGHVPCSFFGGTFANLYQVTISHNAVSNQVEARLEFTIPGYAFNTNEVRSIATKIANTINMQTQVPVNGIFATAYANIDSDGNEAVAPGAEAPANYGRVVIIINNAASSDMYLRTDGANQMLAALNMGNNNIDNVVNLTSTGDITSQNMTAAGLVSGLSLESTLDMISRQDVLADRNIVAGNNIAAGNNIDAANNITAGNDLIVNNNALIAGGLAVEGNVIAEENLFVDGGAKIDGTLEVLGDVAFNQVYLQNARILGANANLSQGIYYATVLTGSTTYSIPKPTYCPANNPLIYTSIQSTGTADEAIVRSEVQVVNSGTTWTVTPILRQIRYDLTGSIDATGGNLAFDKTIINGDASQMKILVYLKCAT